MSSSSVPRAASLLAFLFKAYDEGLVELEIECFGAQRYRWELTPPNPIYHAPERPDPRPWRVISLDTGEEVIARSLPWPEPPAGADGPMDSTVAHITRERYCFDAWARRLSLKLGGPDASPPVGMLSALIDTSPYAARLHLAPGFRVEKPTWQQGWTVRGPDDRGYSLEVPTPGEAVAYALANGVPASSMAPGRPLAEAQKARLLSRVRAWERDAGGCRAIPLTTAGEGEWLALAWSASPPNMPALCLWDRIDAAGASPALKAVLAACEAAHARAANTLTNAGASRDAGSPDTTVDVRAAADWRAMALADMGLHLWALHNGSQTDGAQQDEIEDVRSAAGYTSARIEDNLKSRFAAYVPDEARGSSLARWCGESPRRAQRFLSASNALEGLSAAWIETAMRRGGPATEPLWITGWRETVAMFGAETPLTSLQVVDFGIEGRPAEASAAPSP